MLDTGFGCLPTMIGSMPETDPDKASILVGSYFKVIPAWPQLPKRSPNENMYIQFSQGFPGAIIKEGNVVVEMTQNFNQALSAFYNAYLSDNFNAFPISRDYAAGLYACSALGNPNLHAFKGQVTGPITWGLSVKDSEGKLVLYDDVLGDAIPRFLKLKAMWEENVLRQISERTIMFVDEPYMTAYGSSATMSLSKERVVNSLNEVFSGIKGWKGVHCCGNTDWSVLLATQTDILSFDAYNFAESLSLYPADVKGFLTRNGAVAWGIVPNIAADIAGETVASLEDRLEEAMAPFTRGNDGFHMEDIVTHSLLTPSCGLAGLEENAVVPCFELLNGLSDRMREKYL